MDVHRRSNLQQDGMSECRSFGSIHVSCSQSRKMSIGIVVDSSTKSKTQNVKEKEAAVPASESVLPSKDKPVYPKEVLPPRQVEASEKEKSPWVSTKSCYQKPPTSEANRGVEQTPNLPARTEMSHRAQVEKDAAAKNCVQFSDEGELHCKSNEHKQANVNTVTCRRKAKKDVTTEEAVQTFQPAMAEEVVLEKEVAKEGMFNKAGNKGTETLRVKLWEILEPISPGNKNCLNSKDPDAVAIHPKPKNDANGNSRLSSRRNSDVIESDSERPNHTVRRPTTRSVARYKAPARKQQKEVKKMPTNGYKDHPKKDFLSVKDRCCGELYGAFNDISLPSIGKKSRVNYGVEKHESSHEVYNVKGNDQGKHGGKKVLPNETATLNGNEGGVCKKSSKSTGINSRNLEKDVPQTLPRKTIGTGVNIKSSTHQEHADHHVLLDSPNKNSLTSNGKKSRQNFGVERHESFHEVRNTKENDQVKNRGKRVLPAEKSSLRGNEYAGFKKSSVFSKLNSGQVEREVHETPPRKTIQKQVDIRSPTIQKRADHHEGVCHSPLQDLPQTKYQQSRPNLEMNKVFRTSSFAFSPKTKLGKLDNHNTEGIDRRAFQSFKEFLVTNSDDLRSNAQGNSANDTGNLDDDPSAESAHGGEEDLTSASSAEEWDSESCQDSLPEKGYDSGYGAGLKRTETLYPDTETPVKSISISPPNKRLRNRKSLKVTAFSSASVSPEGGGKESEVQEQLELNQEDGLAGAVTLFALALERVKSKVKSVTDKKSAEILISVAEEVHLQLKNTESQIQADVGKLAGLGKTKRKRLESSAQDLQGQLSVIYERFKEEVNQHLEKCRSTFEGLEAYDSELKRTLEKQRVSHRKMLRQAEETIENRLSDAQTRISTVVDLARGRMTQLKNVLAECLGDGILN